jgi:type VI secretion system secreted protein Hcp
MAADNFIWFPEAAKGGNLSDKGAKPEGESSDNWMGSKTLKALECLSVTFGVSQAETTGSAASGSGAGKAKFEEFTIEKYVDLASVPLYNACTAGAHFPTVMLANRKAGGSQLLYLQYAFRMVFVTSINWSGGGGEEAPKETIKFKFGAMGIQYIRQKSDGQAGIPIEARWSTAVNKPVLTVPGLADNVKYQDASQAKKATS